MCIHDGLDEECGPNCPCDCMACIMGPQDEEEVSEADEQAARLIALRQVEY